MGSSSLPETDALLERHRIGGVCGNDALDRTSLDRDDTHKDVTKASAADDRSLSPPAKSLLEGALIEEARKPFGGRFVGFALDGSTRVVWAFVQDEADVAIP